MKNTDPNINTATPWHATQRAKLADALDAITDWPPFLRGLVGGKILSLSNAVDSLSGKPRASSNHNVVADAIADLSADIAVMAVRANA